MELFVISGGRFEGSGWMLNRGVGREYVFGWGMAAKWRSAASVCPLCLMRAGDPQEGTLPDHVGVSGFQFVHKYLVVVSTLLEEAVV